jgi:hypothetical protein
MLRHFIRIKIKPRAHRLSRRAESLHRFGKIFIGNRGGENSVLQKHSTLSGSLLPENFFLMREVLKSPLDFKINLSQREIHLFLQCVFLVNRPVIAGDSIFLEDRVHEDKKQIFTRGDESGRFGWKTWNSPLWNGWLVQ